MLQYVVISYLKEYFSAHFHSRTLFFIKLFGILNLCLCRRTWTWYGVLLFMILRMFHFFLVIFPTNFNVIFKDDCFCSTYSNRLAPKTNNFFLNTKWHFNGQFIKRVKGHLRCLSLIPVWHIEKENCVTSIWNMGHQFLIGMIFMSCKEILKTLLFV